MKKFIYKLTKFIIEINEKRHQKRMAKIKTVYKSGSTKRAFHGSTELIFNSETEAKKAEIEAKIKEIVKTRLDNPEKLLEYIKETGTDVFRLNYADKFLNLIGEEEGFISPLKGLKALLLNLFVNYGEHKKIVLSFKSNEMFLLRPMQTDIYGMLHQFHKWYSYKMGLPGYDYKTQENFKKTFKSLSDEDISKMSLGDIITLKEAIARDKEAIDFVVNLAKEQEGARKLLEKLKDGKSVNL